MILFTLFSSTAYCWIIDANFEGGTAGQIANGSTGISESFRQTVYTTEQVHEGNMAAKATITAQTDGFGDFGGNWNLKNGMQLGEGDQIWYRVWLYVPQDFDFTCYCTEGPKFMRIHTAAPNGNNEGYWNLHLLTTGITIATSVTQDFYDNHPYPWYDIRKINGKVDKGSWHAYEQYIRFSATPGQGIYRAWYDGKLIFEDTITQTLRSSNSIVDKVQLFTYWRGTPQEQPKKTQSLYVDSIIITNEQPDSKDANGNPYIGVGDATFTAPPNYPSSIKLN